MTNQSFPLIQSGTADAVLAGVWRRILYDLDIDASRLDDLVYQYSTKMTHVSQAKRIQHHGNVSSDLKEPQITWSTFLRGPRHLGAKSVQMDFIFQHLRGRSRHTLYWEYGKPNEPEEVLDADGNKPPTELSIFLIKTMHSLGVDIGTFNSLLTSYMRRTLKAQSTPNNRTYLRGNLKKVFYEPRLSWATLIKAIDFLTIPSFDLEITLTFGGRRPKVTKHHVTINLGLITDMLKEMDESEFLEPQGNIE